MDYRARSNRMGSKGCHTAHHVNALAEATADFEKAGAFHECSLRVQSITGNMFLSTPPVGNIAVALSR